MGGSNVMTPECIRVTLIPLGNEGFHVKLVACALSKLLLVPKLFQNRCLSHSPSRSRSGPLTTLLSQTTPGFGAEGPALPRGTMLSAGRPVGHLPTPQGTTPLRRGTHMT